MHRNSTNLTGNVIKMTRTLFTCCYSHWQGISRHPSTLRIIPAIYTTPQHPRQLPSTLHKIPARYTTPQHPKEHPSTLHKIPALYSTSQHPTQLPSTLHIIPTPYTTPQQDIHKSIRYTDTTPHTDTLIAPDNTIELQSFRISTGRTQYMNIINIYIPPDTCPTVPSNYIPHLHNNLATLPHALIAGAGDSNAKDTAWYTQNQPNIRGQHINTQLHNMFLHNNIDKYRHIPHQALYNKS